MEIKKISVANDLEIYNLAKQCFSSCWTLENFVSTISLNNFLGFFAEESGKIVGFICTTYIYENADIELIAVDSEFRNKGIASSLIKMVESELKSLNVANVFLEVKESNLPAINLYQKNGYQIYSKRKKYYGTEDALLLQKSVR